MQDYTIISIEQMKELTSISENVDVELLRPFLFTAQEMYIRPLLGDSMMDDLVNDAQSGGTKYEFLIENYLYFPLAYATWHSAAPFLHYKTQKKGVVKQYSENSDNVTVEEFGIYAQRIENLMTYYLDRAKDYLEENEDSYPLYKRDLQIGGGNSSDIFLDF